MSFQYGSNLLRHEKKHTIECQECRQAFSIPPPCSSTWRPTPDRSPLNADTARKLSGSTHYAPTTERNPMCATSTGSTSKPACTWMYTRESALGRSYTSMGSVGRCWVASLPWRVTCKLTSGSSLMPARNAGGPLASLHNSSTWESTSCWEPVHAMSVRKPSGIAQHLLLTAQVTHTRWERAPGMMTCHCWWQVRHWN